MRGPDPLERCRGAGRNTPADQLPPQWKAALIYADHDMPVLPIYEPIGSACSCSQATKCPSPGKHPKWDPELCAHGLECATTDPILIRRMAAKWPAANVAIRCDGLVVIDVDGDEGRSEWLALLKANGGHPETLTQRTSRGGHVFFTSDDADSFLSKASFMPGLDIRAGQKAYVLVAPSRHVSGKVYNWVKTDAEVTGLPAWLASLLPRRTKPTPTTGRTTAPAMVTGQTRYGRKALEGIAADLAALPEGSRNDGLNRLAFRAGQLVAAGHLGEEEAHATLTSVALDIGLDNREVAKTWRSGFRSGLEDPDPKIPTPRGSSDSTTTEPRSTPVTGRATPSVGATTAAGGVESVVSGGGRGGALSRMEEALLYLADRTEPNALDGIGFSRDHASELMPLAGRLRNKGAGCLSEEEERRVTEILRVYKRQLREGEFRLSELRPATGCPLLVPRSAPDVLSADLEPPVVLWGSEQEPLLVRGELSLLHAREGVGKSWFVLGLAVAVARGLRTFLDIPVRQARVLVVSPELSPWYEQQRLRLVIGDQPPPSDLLILGRDAAGLDLAQPDHLKQLEKVILEHEPGMLILDPLAALWLCEELNLDFQTLTRSLSGIADAYRVAIKLSHHEAKASSSSKDDDASAFRGGTALRAGVRTAIRLAQEPISKGVRVAFTKSNLGKLPRDLFLEGGEPWKFVLGEAPPSPKEVAQATDEKLREFLIQNPNSTARAIAAGIGIAESTIGRVFGKKNRAPWLKRTKAEGKREFLYYVEGGE